MASAAASTPRPAEVGAGARALHRVDGMRGAGVLAVILVAVPGGCRRGPGRHPAAPRGVCGAAAEALGGRARGSGLDEMEAATRAMAAAAGRKVTRVTVRGPALLAEAPLDAAVTTRVGERFARRRIEDDLRRLWRLGVVDGARVELTPEPAGVAIAFVVEARPLVRRVIVAGATREDGVRVARAEALAGAIYNPMRVHRAGQRIADELQVAGHIHARVAVRSARAGPGLVDVCFAAAAGPRFAIARLEFPGRRRLGADALAALVRRQGGKVNAPGGVYRAEQLHEDLVKIEAAYYDAGMIEVRVRDPEAIFDARHGRVEVRVPVHEGAVYRIGTIGFKGVARADRPAYRKALGAARGEVFRRSTVGDGVEKIRGLERDRGHAGDVWVETHLDADHHVIDLTIEVTR